MSPTEAQQLMIAERQAHTRLTYLLRVYGSSGVSLEKLDAAWKVWRALAADVAAKVKAAG